MSPTNSEPDHFVNHTCATPAIRSLGPLTAPLDTARHAGLFHCSSKRQQRGCSQQQTCTCLGNRADKHGAHRGSVGSEQPKIMTFREAYRGSRSLRQWSAGTRIIRAIMWPLICIPASGLGSAQQETIITHEGKKSPEKITNKNLETNRTPKTNKKSANR